MPTTLLRALVATSLSVALVVGALSTPAAATATTAEGTRRYASWVTIHPFHHHQTYLHRFSISGQVRYRKNGTPYAAAGVRVTLLRKPAGSSSWRRVGTDKTSNTAKPTYSFSVRARSNSVYRVRFAGNSELQPCRKDVRVRVHRRVPSRVRQQGPADLQLVGHVVPSYRHRHVALMKRDCKTCSWHRVRSKRTTRRSHFSFDIGSPRHGSWYFRVRVRGTTSYARSYSATYRTYTP